MTKIAKKSHMKKIWPLSAVIASCALLILGCVKNEPINTTGLPKHDDWTPLYQTNQHPIATFYVNNKHLQEESKNTFTGMALMQPIWYTQTNPDGTAGQTAKADFSLVWEFAINCDTKKLESYNYAIVKGLFAEGQASSVNAENPYTEKSDVSKKIIKHYCQK